MLQAPVPAALEQHALRSISCAVERNQRTACIVPTTAAVLDLAKRYYADAALAIACPRFSDGKATLKSLLSRVAAAQDVPQTIVVFSDQLVDPTEATLLVHDDSGDGFFSPLESILNIKYGYDLEIWTAEGPAMIPARTGTLESILTRMLGYIRSCDALGQQWTMREHQGMRTPAFRAYQARRKLRFFRSSVFHAYMEEPTHPEIARLLAHAETLEQIIDNVASPA